MNFSAGAFEQWWRFDVSSSNSCSPTSQLLEFVTSALNQTVQNVLVISLWSSVHIWIKSHGGLRFDSSKLFQPCPSGFWTVKSSHTQFPAAHGLPPGPRRRCRRSWRSSDSCLAEVKMLRSAANSTHLAVPRAAGSWVSPVSSLLNRIF